MIFRGGTYHGPFLQIHSRKYKKEQKMRTEKEKKKKIPANTTSLVLEFEL